MTTVYIYDIEDLVNFLIFNLSRLPVIILATYGINYFVVYKRLAIPSPLYKESVLIFLVLFIAATVLDRVIIGFDVFEPTLHGQPLYYSFINPMPMLKNGFLLLSIMGLGASVQFFLYLYKQQKEIHTLKEEKLETQLAFLKNQINPHFLFNTFNNLFSIASRNNQSELAQGLAGLAGLMRYLTYESNVPTVPLQKEVELIRSFIELQKLRIADDQEVMIDLKCMGDFSSHYIAPVLLLPLVENAFKHSLFPSQPIAIAVSIEVINNQLVFQISNRIPTDSVASAVGGVGLENLKKRLELIYPKRNQLDIGQENGYFKVSLLLDLVAHKELLGPVPHE